MDTLKSAIKNDRLSHAYLFTGPRGTGKTSVARLLARAANCTETDPAKRPCGKCDNCKIEIGSHLDLIEIDAASNRGIDDARALREKITSAPSIGRYKVYIIDEVHMLTTEAFNALLKTLEEPPSHAMFIMATTEFHKLPETIVSRTQRFSFKPIDPASIQSHIKEIAKKENIQITDDAVEIIAISSRGGFRDAISLLDQAANSGASPLDASVVRDLLGHGDPKILQAIISSVENMDTPGLLKNLDEAWRTGVQPGQLTRQLIDSWRFKIREFAEREEDSRKIQRSVVAIETLIPVLKTSWPELALEAALVKLSTGGVEAVTFKKTVTSLAPVAVKPKPAQEKNPEKSTSPVAPQPTGQPSGDLWIKTLTQIKQKNNPLYALLRSSVSVHFEGDEVIMGCRFIFHRDRIKEAKNMQLIEQTLARVYGRKYRVLVQLESKPSQATPKVDPSAELMSSALEILGGEVIHD